jgi:hypothetical protein
MNNSLGFEGILKPYKVPITKLNLAKIGVYSYISAETVS